MTKLIKRITAPVLSLIILLNMSSAGMAETTVSWTVMDSRGQWWTVVDSDGQ